MQNISIQLVNEPKVIYLENRNCTAKQVKNRFVKTGVNIRERIVRNRQNELGFYIKKKRPNENQQWHKNQMKMRLKLAKKKLSHKNIFCDESRICIDQVDYTRTFHWCRSNETTIITGSKINFPSHSWGYILFKGHGKMVIITLTTNMHVYSEILIPSTENWFHDDKLIFQDDDTSFPRAKRIKAFLPERHVKLMIGPANSPDRNPIGNFACKLKKKCFMRRLHSLKMIKLLPFKKVGIIC